ncbi:hypothetical protein [Novilysobacter erysipheiresistens]|uniref:Phage tail protein n=1 Tax=Novilysobacter erysipheiresistens TaxID=1749332 RepID=A0ABU7YUN6_9GAMM
MSKLKILGAGAVLTSAVAQTGVEMDGSPFSRGFNAIATINLTGATGTPTVLIEGSDDDTTYTTLMTVSAITASMVKAEVTLQPYMRVRVSAVGTAGTVSAWLEA